MYRLFARPEGRAFFRLPFALIAADWLYKAGLAVLERQGVREVAAQVKRAQGAAQRLMHQGSETVGI